MDHSTATPAPKPAKPYEGFPLFPHATGRWAKKIRGRMVYFGKWADGWQAALGKYDAEKEALHAGRRPRDREPQGTTVRELCNDFWNAKNGLVETGELSPVTFITYERTTDRLLAAFGKSRLVSDVGPDDFAELRTKLAKTLGPVALGNEIQRVRSVFKFAQENGLVEKSILFGSGFKRPSQKTKRLAKASQGKKLFSPEEIRRIIAAAGIPLKAMLLLAINAGFGNSDCANLPIAAVDLAGGIIDFARPKTGVERRCPLWPETVNALRAAIGKRPTPKRAEHSGLLFITKRGLSWSKATSDNPVSKEARKLLDELGINGHRGFYTLRHVFQTIGDESRDFVAVRFIMGHADSSMSAAYREDVSDERLRAVVEHVRTWLFGPDKSPKKRPRALSSR